MYPFLCRRTKHVRPVELDQKVLRKALLPQFALSFVIPLASRHRDALKIDVTTAQRRLVVCVEQHVTIQFRISITRRIFPLLTNSDVRTCFLLGQFISELIKFIIAIT